MVVPFVYTEEEYKKLEERVKFLEEENNNLKNELMEDMKYETKLEQENKKLNENVERYKKHYLADEEYLECQDNAIKNLKKDLAYERTMLDNVKAEYENLQEINEKLKDDFMKMLYMYYNMPATSNEIAILVKEQYSKWYDEVKNQMRKEIKEEKSDF